jgi:DNA-binding transcriptional LysR family regulator
MKKWLKKITGVEELERAAKEAAQRREQEELEIRNLRQEKLKEEELAAAARQDHELARMSPKERATAKGEPWINVLDVKVNQDNIRNGFFEMDWNEYFIKELIFNGYGTEADPEEEIVDRWFRDIVYQMLDQEGLDTSRGAGYINVVPIDKGKSEVS